MRNSAEGCCQGWEKLQATRGTGPGYGLSVCVCVQETAVLVNLDQIQHLDTGYLQAALSL